MPPDPTPPSGGNPSEPTISVEHNPSRAPGFDVAVRLGGEHDLASSDELRLTLAALYANVLVDLTACEFIDSTIIAALLACARDRTSEGQRLELLVPAVNRTVTRTLAVAGVETLLTIRTSMP